MYHVSANFHNLSTQDAPKTRVRIYFIGDGVDCTNDYDVRTNGTLLVGAVGDTDSNGRIGQDGITFTEYYNPELNIEIGRAVSSQIEMTLLNTDGALDNFGYGRCKVFLDVYDSANATWLSCPMGVYIIEIPTRRKSQLIHAFGYDQMQKLDMICDSWWAGLNWSNGLTLLQIAKSMASQVGVGVSPASTSAIVNSSVTYISAPFDCVETTYRDVLETITEATGTVARFDRDGALDLKWFNAAQISGNTVQIDTDTVGNQCLGIDLAEYQVAAIDLLKVKIAEDDVGVTVGSGTNQYTILDNLFLDGSVATITTRATAIYNRLNAIGAYKPIQTKLIWDWSIEAGDIIEIVRDSTTYTVPIFQQTMKWRGGYVVSDLANSGDAVRPVPNYAERSTYRMQSEMSAKVGDNEIISRINQSPEAITIQASKVDLTGYVTFTNLSTPGQTVIDGGNITSNSISVSQFTSTAQGALAADATTKMQYYLSTSSSSATGGTWSDTVPTWASGKYVWTREATTVTLASGGTTTNYSTAVYDKNLTTALSTATSASSAASAAQTTANGANAQEQLIYISKPSGTTTVAANTTWVTNTTGSQNTWTLKRPEYNSSYPVLFVATQRKAVDGTVTCTTPMIDLTTTVIDGGHITTGTIDASVVSVTNLNASNITSGTLSANYISGGTLTVGGQNNTDGVILIKDSANAASGRIDNAGIAVGGTESQQGHKLIANFKPSYTNINDATTGKTLYYLQAAVPGATDGYTQLKLYGYQSGAEVSSVELNANPSSNGGYLELKGNGATTRLNSDGTYAGDLTLASGDITVYGDATINNNVAINGVLDVKPLRCSSTLSGIGWKRAINFNVGDANISKFSVATILDISIGTSYSNNNNCLRSISLYGTYNSPVFLNETSKTTNTNLIDKIRFTTDSSNNGHIDIHYNVSTQNPVWVSFVPHLPAANLNWFVASNLGGVADSPSGETVVAEYSFTDNTDGEISAPVSSVATASVVSPSCFRSGQVVSYHFGMQHDTSGAIDVSNGTVLATGLVPPSKAFITLGHYYHGVLAPLRCQVTTSGTLVVYYDTGTIPSQYNPIVFEINYIAK